MPKSAGFTSTVSISRKGSQSVKTTVPSGIAKIMKLVDGDELVWNPVPKGDKFIITVEKTS